MRECAIIYCERFVIIYSERLWDNIYYERLCDNILWEKVSTCGTQKSYIIWMFGLFEALNDDDVHFVKLYGEWLIYVVRLLNIWSWSSIKHSFNIVLSNAYLVSIDHCVEKYMCHVLYINQSKY